MSNGNGVTATLGNAAESFADRAKEIGSAVTKRASKAVKSAKKTAKQAEKAVSKTAGKAKKAVTRRVTKAKKSLASASASAKAEAARSEEHTSELQSLMRISYAVFCLKKKTKNRIIHPV